MKFMENMKKERKDNRGFSLVELIIVIAIMAILVGIVGTQVIPYLNRSKEAKDLQILNSYSTAAVSAYSLNAEAVTADMTFKVYGSTAGADTAEGKMVQSIKELTGYSTKTVLNNAMGSSKGKTIDDVEVVIDLTNHKITVKGVQADGTTDIGIGTVESII